MSFSVTERVLLKKEASLFLWQQFSFEGNLRESASICGCGFAFLSFAFIRVHSRFDFLRFAPGLLRALLGGYHRPARFI
jgi:hypothetical protein